MASIEHYKKRAAREQQAREQAESILEEKTRELYFSKIELQLILETIKEGIISLDINGTIKYLNPFAATMLGLESTNTQDLQNINAYIKLSDDTKDINLDFLLQTAINRQKSHKLAKDILLRNNKNERYIVECRLLPIAPEDNNYPLAILTFNDITERATLNKTIRQHALFFELNPNPVLRINDKGHITHYNNSAKKHFVSETGKLNFPMHDKINTTKLIKENGTIITESTINQQAFQLAFCGVPEINAVNIYATNVSKLKNTEKKLILANQTKINFLSHMSHELRTPLNAILGFTQILASNDEGNLSKSQLENVNFVFKAGEHLLYLVNQLLDLSRIEANEITVKIETVDLNKIIAQSVSLVTNLLTKHNVAIKLHDSLTNAPFVLADQNRILQVITNLISNAIKYSHQGGQVYIKAKSSNNHLVLSVVDNGIGISAADKEQLFKPFTRFGNKKELVDGVGIGLALTKTLVTLMKGTMGLESAPGKGSVFWVKLPIADKNAHNQYNQAATSQKSKTILYIEDERSNIELMKKVFAKHNNIKCHYVMSAEECIKQIDKIKPDLLFVDIDLPGMNGIELYSHLKKHKMITNSTEVIVVSANAMPEQIAIAKKRGIKKYITKPFNINLIHEILHKFSQ